MQRFPIIATGPGASRQVLCKSPSAPASNVKRTSISSGLSHSHPHVQATFCASGRFRFEVAGEAFEVVPGMSFTIPSGAVHGCLCLEPGVLIDAFTPRRDDFL